MKHNELKPDYCPYCFNGINQHSSQEGASPKPGDVTICCFCGELLLYNQWLRITKPPPDFMEQLAQEAPASFLEVQVIQAKVRADGKGLRDRLSADIDRTHGQK